jgi:hypothetical protein
VRVIVRIVCAMQDAPIRTMLLYVATLIVLPTMSAVTATANAPASAQAAGLRFQTDEDSRESEQRRLTAIAASVDAQLLAAADVERGTAFMPVGTSILNAHASATPYKAPFTTASYAAIAVMRAACSRAQYRGRSIMPSKFGYSPRFYDVCDAFHQSFPRTFRHTSF